MIHGVVQGVGFRPAIYRLARELGLRGTVQNIGGAVEILATGPLESLDRLVRELRAAPPAHAHIEALELHTVPPFAIQGFAIVDSGRGGSWESRFLSPDLAVCPACLAELDQPEGRRHRHSFNTCVSCGPRFSVIEALPYDRENTSMAAFPLCDHCRGEYTAPDNRRYHAETIACNSCGPRLLYRSRQGESSGGEALAQAISWLKTGGIVAIKGIGGYHFACSPFSESAVTALRELKGREGKPFAVMFHSLDTIREVCAVDGGEEELLLSNPRPITLLRLLDDPFAPSVLLDDRRCGCFLPYTPLHHLLLRDCRMLVLTSANLSGSPICRDNGEMLRFWEEHSALVGVLYHHRRIVRAVEDSVAQWAGGGPQILRRSRGYVPQALPLENPQSRPLLAMGGDLKAAFCLVKDCHAYMSPYFGDLEDAGVHSEYTAAIADLQGLLAVEPELVVCDSHPGYHSALYAGRLGLPVVRVQHHHAHIASVMAEHGLDGPVLGVAFDGTGWGDDGAVWGGEFLLCQGAESQRVAHLAYTPLQGGDSSAADARKTATCFLRAAGIDGAAFDSRAGIIGAALEKGVGVAPSSSMGRLFDGVAALLGICGENTYEGECAILLQRSAEAALLAGTAPVPMAFALEEEGSCILASSKDLIALLHCRDRSGDVGAYALGFHHAVSEMVALVCSRLREGLGVGQVALSGGVFQNSLLLELCLGRLEAAGFRCFCNRQVPPSDGGIALGQAYIGANRSIIRRY